MKYVISILMDDKIGALARITELFTSRGYNVDSICSNCILIHEQHNHKPPSFNFIINICTSNNFRKHCRTSMVLMDGRHCRRKLKRTIFFKTKSLNRLYSNCSSNNSFIFLRLFQNTKLDNGRFCNFIFISICRKINLMENFPKTI